jgi:GTPase SAR1 family protein
MWKHYYPETDAVIFVIDSTDVARMEVAAIELQKVMDTIKVKTQLRRFVDVKGRSIARIRKQTRYWERFES